MNKLLLIFVLMINVSCAFADDLYQGESSSKEWNARSICQTARKLAKDSLSDEQKDYIYTKKCTVIKLTSPLKGVFSGYRPYAATWKNGVAIRAFETKKGLKIMGISKKGVNFSWNKDHKPLATGIKKYINECKELFVKEVKAKKIKVTKSKKYDDLSGANIEIKYRGKGNIKTKGTCLFDRNGMTMATSKVKKDKYAKTVFSNF